MIHTDKTYKPTPYEGAGDLQSGKVLQRLRVASKFRVGPLTGPRDQDQDQQSATSEGYPVDNYNPVDSFLEVSDRNLYSGQLTTVGFYQHILLGEHLSVAYGPLLRKIQAPASNPLIVIRSTSYNRTIQSVAAMLSSFLPYSVHFSDVHIHFQPHSSLENMHGFVSNKVHSSGSPTLGGQITVHDDVSSKSTLKKAAKASNCPKATAALRRMASSYDDTTPETFQRLTNIYSPLVMQPYSTLAHITEVADPLMTSFCHQERFACGQESRKCGSESLLRAVMVDSDRSFCERYTSVDGGLEYTRLDIYPFMTEVKDALVAAAEEVYSRPKSGSSSSSSSDSHHPSSSPPLVHVFSGHDTVIAPVLTALGIYQHSSFCNWPNYASRIAFEAWSPVGKNAKKYSKHRGEGNKMFSLHNSNIHVRVVYNGVDVTGHIPACATASVQYGKKKGAVRASLCPLELFVKQIESNLGGSESLEEACQR